MEFSEIPPKTACNNYLDYCVKKAFAVDYLNEQKYLIACLLDLFHFKANVTVLTELVIYLQKW